MEDKNNLELRKKVLEIALILEDNVNTVLLVYLKIGSEERKAITYKSGNLSFKNKIDLLFDLEIFNKEEHKQFLLVMEFRNQFLHNIYCNSFKYAVTSLGKDKENSLLKHTTGEAVDIETKYFNAYINLYHKTLKIIYEKWSRRKQIILDKSELLKNFSETVDLLIKGYSDVYNNLSIKHEANEFDTAEIVKLKDELLGDLEKEIKKIYSSEEFTRLRKQHTDLTSIDELRQRLL